MLSNRITYLTPPPRWVPLPVICSAMLGIVGGMGALFFISGMLFAWVFVGDFNPVDEWRLARSTTTAQATVTEVADTNASENDVTVYAYTFTFRTPEEKTITARSYSRGRVWSEGDRVTVWYLPDKPSVARLEETRMSTFAPWALFVLIFPAVGVIMFTLATITGVRQVMLLRYGEITGARTLSQEATNTTVNDQPVMKYTYEFRSTDGMSYSGSSKSLPTEKIGDEANEPVLYLPSNPNVSMLVDALPLRYPLDVDGSGQWVSGENMWPVIWYGLAWLGILANVVFGWLRFTGVF